MALAAPLTREEERALILRCQEGDRVALEELVRRHWGSIHCVAKKYRRVARRLCVPRQDLVQAAAIGFLRGVAQFDTGRPARLMALAKLTARTEVTALLRRETLAHALAPVSLDEPLQLESGDSTTLGEQLASDGPDPEKASTALLDRALRRVLDGKGPLRRLDLVSDVLKSRLLEDAEPLEAVAARWGVSRQRIFQIEAVLRRAVAHELEPEREAEGVEARP